jgi:hypothetical protein
VPVGPPAGWYTDPVTGSGSRWWDGTAWSEHTTYQGTATGLDSGSDRRPVLDPVGDWLREVQRTVVERAGHLFTLVVVVLLPAGMANGMVGWLFLRHAVLELDETLPFTFTNEGVGLPAYLALALSYLVHALAALLLSVAAIRHAAAAGRGDPEAWSFSLIDGARRMVPAVGVTLAVLGSMVVALVVVSVVAPVLLILTFQLWVAVSLWGGVRFGFAPVAAALAPPGTNPLRASWEVTRSSFWAVAGRFVVLALVGVMVANLGRLVMAVANPTEAPPVDSADQEIRFELFYDPNPAVHAIGLVFGTLGWGAALVVAAAGLAHLYRDLDGPIETPAGTDQTDQGG